MTTENFCFYLQHGLIQTSQTGGQQYNDTSHFSIPWPNNTIETLLSNLEEEEEEDKVQKIIFQHIHTVFKCSRLCFRFIFKHC
jgi:hypothetical protein